MLSQTRIFFRLIPKKKFIFYFEKHVWFSLTACVGGFEKSLINKKAALFLSCNNVPLNSILLFRNIRISSGYLFYFAYLVKVSYNCFTIIKIFLDVCNRPALVERMPVLDEAAYIGKKASSSSATLSTEKTSHSNSSGVTVSLPNGVTKPPAAPLVDLLDLTSDDVPVSSSSGGDFLQDLLGIGSSPNSSLPGLFPPILIFFFSFFFPCKIMS